MSRDFQPFVSLDGATTVGPGAALDMEDLFRDFTLCVTTAGMATANPLSSITVELEGSHDGQNWALLEIRTVTGSSRTTLHTANKAVTAPLVRYVRANLVALTAGSGSPSVTASVAIAAGEGE